MRWFLVEVFNYDEYLGYFYTTEFTKKGLISQINEIFGNGNWTRYKSE